MRFLLIAGYADSVINFRGPLLKAIQKMGIEVHVAAPDLEQGSPVRQRLEACGFRVHNVPLQRVGMNPLADIRSLFHLWRLMKLVGPDYVLGYTVKPVIYGLLAARLARVPRRYALITGLGYAFQGQGDAHGSRKYLLLLVKKLYALALSGAHKVFFQNPDDQKLFNSMKLLDSSAKSMVVNGSGVDVTSFSVAVLPPKLCFLMIARFLGDKGIREYADAARRVKAIHPNVTFSLVGWIDDNPDAIKNEELDKWVTEGIIEYQGRLSDVRPSIMDCSVYVLPSYREGTPRTVLEAMSMGRAIITTDAPGCRETVTHGVNGFLVPIKNVESLVSSMLYYVENPVQLTIMGAASRAIAEDKYDVHKVNTVMVNEMFV